jgi:hypothetical protein
MFLYEGGDGTFAGIESASVKEPHHFYAAPAPTLLYSKANFFKQTKV